MGEREDGGHDHGGPDRPLDGQEPGVLLADPRRHAGTRPALVTSSGTVVMSPDRSWCGPGGRTIISARKLVRLSHSPDEDYRRPGSCCQSAAQAPPRGR